MVICAVSVCRLLVWPTFIIRMSDLHSLSPTDWSSRWAVAPFLIVHTVGLVSAVAINGTAVSTLPLTITCHRQ